ncbi:MAG: UDP-N-acetylglucosamine 1-carboxyvinyltransferase [Candidatus Magasanikbacteria bacterium]|jgi:UDP-N-acetylglucosamine 1-carboxyvinyltransferase|nr:UDP-N-acetylglucosamine 1-carboxyvinyltransferase [Candidatus Magasanikbacteria bacterium]MBT4221419.1 UDP-N-acetylglucosamine 1-carboxyvinyltransferase [Candidatus Magasanikbacteria bacterium]MBT4350733.1 UDP-N-acetylglucosamine 1-carboxyvinyltransferase [Candidatus Magasanikbacteria bacterium]MBT4541591.1 UDP-N-acetylglucosamine 1-carboxyvinyltransferase [Candidatus Magasanikbacteria bacterium]MBT6253543.1 UDP-N-acetylglucosamine 1-carboxyvinyltransferase [Candidatus Magasanikbacteria bact
MSKYIIQGGKQLSGTISVVSGKNATIALFFASLLLKGKVLFKDVTKVAEVFRVLEILESIGVRYEWMSENSLLIDTSKKLTMATLDKKASASTRISLLLLGGLASREKTYKIYRTGGCKLGKRTVGPHLYALQKLGISIDSQKGHYLVKNKKLVGTEIVMYESGDTPTENTIMAAVLAKGVTVIKFASANYMVQDLCHFLVAAGAKITGIGTTTLTIHGVKRLHDVKEYYISPDPIDAMAWISLAITTKSPLTVKNCPLPFLELELEKLRVMGQIFKLTNRRMSTNGHVPVADIKIVPSALKALSDKITCRPYPGLNIDNLPFFAPIATQAKGKTLIHDWPYENRALYNLEFKKLGANVLLLDPHRALIEGPTKLKGAEIVAPYAIRPAMSLLIAMIAAKGTSVLLEAYPIERAYDRIIERLRGVGVNIERIDN